jgi:hypothetical protein
MLAFALLGIEFLAGVTTCVSFTWLIVTGSAVCLFALVMPTRLIEVGAFFDVVYSWLLSLSFRWPRLFFFVEIEAC